MKMKIYKSTSKEVKIYFKCFNNINLKFSARILTFLYITDVCCNLKVIRSEKNIYKKIIVYKLTPT